MMKTDRKNDRAQQLLQVCGQDTVSAILIAKLQNSYLHFLGACDRVAYTRVVADLTGWPSGDNPGTFLPFSRALTWLPHDSGIPTTQILHVARTLVVELLAKRIWRH
jgi:hypothetical protein